MLIVVSFVPNLPPFLNFLGDDIGCLSPHCSTINKVNDYRVLLLLRLRLRSKGFWGLGYWGFGINKPPNSMPTMHLRLLQDDGLRSLQVIELESSEKLLSNLP